PRTLANDEAGLEKALPGVTNAKGQEANGLGQARVNGFGADCCRSAPGVLEFDASGKLLRSWGGPSDPGWLASHCKEEQGCIWPNVEHGIYVDHRDNVWIAGNSERFRITRLPEPPTAMAAMASSSNSTWTAISKCGSAACSPLRPATIAAAASTARRTCIGRPTWWWIRRPTGSMWRTAMAIAAY